MTGKAVTRSCDELSDTVLVAGDMKAIASGNPKIAEKMKLDNEIARLKMMQRTFINEKEEMCIRDRCYCICSRYYRVHCNSESPICPNRTFDFSYTFRKNGRCKLFEVHVEPSNPYW